MPQYWEFVFASYGAFILSVGGYFWYLVRQHRKNQAALRQLEQK